MNTSLSRTAVKMAVVALALLLVPLAAMLFTRQVDWGIEDFAAAAILLFAAGMAYPIAARLLRSPFRRVAVTALVVLLLVTLWAHLAVGVFS